MEVSEFDKFREEYRGMSYKDQSLFYSKVYSEYPVQKHCSLGLAYDFFSRIGSVSVTEVGGWDGGVAKELLNRFPQIKTWTNYEICPEAVLNSIQDERYIAYITNDYIWNLPLSIDSECMFMSHSLEHMRLIQFTAIAQKFVKAKYAYLEAPIAENYAADWTGDLSTHVMTNSWPDIEQSMESLGFQVIEKYPNVRFFRREV